MKNILAILTAALAVCVCTVEGYARGGIINIITYGGEVCGPVTIKCSQGSFTVYNGQNGTGAGDFMADGSVPMTGALNMGGNKITNTAEPTADTDVATKEYVDDTITVALVGNYIPAGERGAASGVATLDASTKVPAAQLPAAGTAIGGVKQMTAIADLSAAPTMEDFNNLLAALRTAGMLAT